MYNYLDAMKADVLAAIRDNYTLSDYETREELEERLNDELWIDDSVTGNASGSYTCNASQAAEMVREDGEEYVADLIRDFDLDAETVAAHLFDWEYWDVSIRCYLLGQAIAAALDELEEEFIPADDDADADDAETAAEPSAV